MKTEIVVIEYNPSGEVQSTIVKFVFELGAILIILGIAGLVAFWTFEQLSRYQIPETINGRPALPGLAILMATVAVLAIGLCTGSIKHVNNISNSFLSRKQSIRLTEAGMICPFGETFHLQGRLWRKWEEITGVLLVRSNRITSNTDCQMILKFADGCKLNLNLHKMQKEEVDKLILAVEMWTPKAIGLPDFYELSNEIGDELKLLDKPNFTSIWNDDLNRRFSLATFIPLSPGAKLQHGRYQVTSPISTGGLNAVYAGVARGGELVVIKEVAIDHLDQLDLKDALLKHINREAELLSRLKHEKICRMLDSFVEQGRHYIVLERIFGATLRQIVLTSGPKEEQEVLAISMQMIEILEYLHSQKPAILHRDFTPDNLIWRDDVGLVLIDFNAATEFLAGATGTIIGKHCYMPPEQIRGKSEMSSDYYSMGNTIYFILSGKDPKPLTAINLIESGLLVSPKFSELVRAMTASNSSSRPTLNEIKQSLIDCAITNQAVT